MELYRERWGIERVLQQATEVLGLERLTGGRREASVFQFAFCLLLYNQIQIVRAYVLKHLRLDEDCVSLEQVFVDVRRELIAWAVVVGVAGLPTRSAAETRSRLEDLLRLHWTDRWGKSIRGPSIPCGRPSRLGHVSAYRALFAAKP